MEAVQKQLYERNSININNKYSEKIKKSLQSLRIRDDAHLQVNGELP